LVLFLKKRKMRASTLSLSLSRSLSRSLRAVRVAQPQRVSAVLFNFNQHPLNGGGGGRFYHGSLSLLKSVVQNVPPLGESITEGTIARWLKNEGDQVDVDEVVCIVETDKVTVDLKSEHAGKFLKKMADTEVPLLKCCLRASIYVPCVGSRWQAII
jgi:hypothetical protein